MGSFTENSFDRVRVYDNVPLASLSVRPEANLRIWEHRQPVESEKMGRGKDSQVTENRARLTQVTLCSQEMTADLQRRQNEHHLREENAQQLREEWLGPLREIIANVSAKV